MAYYRLTTTRFTTGLLQVYCRFTADLQQGDYKLTTNLLLVPGTGLQNYRQKPRVTTDSSNKSM